MSAPCCNQCHTPGRFLEDEDREHLCAHCADAKRALFDALRDDILNDDSLLNYNGETHDPAAY